MRLTTLLASFVVGAVAFLLGILPAQAQQLEGDRYTVLTFIAVCGIDPEHGYVNAAVSWDGAPETAPQSISLRPGQRFLNVSLRPPAGEEGKWMIEKIERRDSNTNERTVLATPGASTAALLVDVAPPTVEESVLMLDITVDKCARLVHVKIATTASCTGTAGENFTVQPNVTVKLGEHTFISNDKGVIEADIPMGYYNVTAAWFGAPTAYVTQSGLAQRKDENTGITQVRLDAAEETLEIRMQSCGDDGREIVRATIEEMGDSIQVQRSNASGNGFVGMKLRDGDLVTVNGYAKISWEDGHIATFRSGGKAVFRIGRGERAPADPKKKDTKAAVMIFLGGLAEFFFPTQPKPERKFGASTNSVMIAIKGTQFTLEHDEATSTTTIALTEGLIGLTPVNTDLPPFDLHPGEQVSVSLTAVSPITPIGGTTAAAGTYLGCYADTPVFDLDGFLERSPQNTPQSCLAICTEKGFKYAGVQYGESCLCGNSYGRYGVATVTQCDYACTGDNAQFCGGYNANSVYATGN